VRFLRKLEYKLGKYAIKNLMLYIIGAMGVVFIADVFTGSILIENGIYDSIYYKLTFDREAILQGEVWRIFSFIFLPPIENVLFMVLALYFYYFIGSGLEYNWGAFRFNVYYFTGIIMLIISGFIVGYTSNEYLNLSLFFAFATLYPDYEIRLFFIIRVKMKIIAILDALFYAIVFVLGNWTVRITILFVFLNYFIFFGGYFFGRIKFFFKYKQYKVWWNKIKNLFKR